MLINKDKLVMSWDRVVVVLLLECKYEDLFCICRIRG